MNDIPSTEDFLKLSEPPEQQQGTLKLATVTSLFENGTAKVKFDGEETASEKQYSYLSSYGPESNDRVVMASIAGTYIILGKVAYNMIPSTNVNDLTVRGHQIVRNGQTIHNGQTVNGGQDVSGGLSVSGIANLQEGLELDGSLTHKGLAIGFFGKTPVNKRSVPVPNSIVTYTAGSTYTTNERNMLNSIMGDLENLRSKLYAAITALQAYGLN